MIDDDLEDGEIEDDDDDTVEIVKPPSPKPTIKETEEKHQKSPEKRSSDSRKSSSRKERISQDEDDFMSNIESQIAQVLKKDGVEPPMPSIKRPKQESDEERKPSNSRSARKRRNRQAKRDREKRENVSSKVIYFSLFKNYFFCSLYIHTCSFTRYRKR